MKLTELLTLESLLIVPKSPLCVKQALQLCCHKLVELKKVTPNYPLAVIDNHIKWGPYYVLAPKIALPHARSEDGVLEDALQVTVFKEGIDFGNQDNGPSFVCVTLAALKPEIHNATIRALIPLFEQEDDINRIVNASSPKDILEVFRRY